MKNQISGEWDFKTSKKDYFTRQYRDPYQSTIAFFDYIEEKDLINTNSIIVDACCGTGANTFYAAKRFCPKKIIGFDNQKLFLSVALEYQKNKYSKTNQSTSFLEIDIYEINKFTKILRQKNIKSIDGVIFLQTMSWLIDWKESLYQLNKLNPEWIGISSLFYEGLIEAQISINEYPDTKSECSSHPHNVYSIPIVEEYLKKLDLKIFIGESSKYKSH